MGANPVWISTQAFRDIEASPTAIGLTMELIARAYLPLRQGFRFEPKALAIQLEPGNTTREDLEALLIEYRYEVARFFTILPDGRWAPSPEFFSMNDTGAEKPN